MSPFSASFLRLHFQYLLCLDLLKPISCISYLNFWNKLCSALAITDNFIFQSLNLILLGLDSLVERPEQNKREEGGEGRRGKRRKDQWHKFFNVAAKDVQWSGWYEWHDYQSCWLITDQSECLNVGAPVKEKDGADLGREERKKIVKQNNNKK